jgi:hypothetical protein
MSDAIFEAPEGLTRQRRAEILHGAHNAEPKKKRSFYIRKAILFAAIAACGTETVRDYIVAKLNATEALSRRAQDKVDHGEPVTNMNYEVVSFKGATPFFTHLQMRIFAKPLGGKKFKLRGDVIGSRWVNHGSFTVPEFTPVTPSIKAPLTLKALPPAQPPGAN